MDHCNDTNSLFKDVSYRLFDDQYNNVTDFAHNIINEFVFKEKFVKKENDLSNLKSFVDSTDFSSGVLSNRLDASWQ